MATTPGIFDELVGAMQPSGAATSTPETAGTFHPRAKGAAKIVLNRKALDEVTLAVADGMFELAKSIVAGAAVPDAPPLGQGLVEGGGVIAWVRGRQIGNWSTSGDRVAKPRSAAAGKGITAIGGYGFPARFLEEGTVKMAAEPFLTPSLLAQVPEAINFVREACIKHKVISDTRAAVGDVHGAHASKEARATVRRTRKALRKIGSGGGV